MDYRIIDITDLNPVKKIMQKIFEKICCFWL